MSKTPLLVDDVDEMDAPVSVAPAAPDGQDAALSLIANIAGTLADAVAKAVADKLAQVQPPVHTGNPMSFVTSQAQAPIGQQEGFASYVFPNDAKGVRTIALYDMSVLEEGENPAHYPINGSVEVHFGNLSTDDPNVIRQLEWMHAKGLASMTRVN